MSKVRYFRFQSTLLMMTVVMELFVLKVAVSPMLVLLAVPPPPGQLVVPVLQLTSLVGVAPAVSQLPSVGAASHVALAALAELVIAAKANKTDKSHEACGRKEMIFFERVFIMVRLN